MGVVKTEDELFYGLFEEGLLNRLGVMSFKNSEFYLGEFQRGNMRGIGMYSTPEEKKYLYD